MLPPAWHSPLPLSCLRGSRFELPRPPNLSNWKYKDRFKQPEQQTPPCDRVTTKALCFSHNSHFFCYQSRLGFPNVNSTFLPHLLPRGMIVRKRPRPSFKTNSILLTASPDTTIVIRHGIPSLRGECCPSRLCPSRRVCSYFWHVEFE